MAETVRRVALPSGGWWDVETRPPVRAMQRLQNVNEGVVDATYEALVVFTRAWSFPEPVSAEAIQDRRFDDFMSVVKVFEEEVAPFLAQYMPKPKPSSSSPPSSGEMPSPTTG